MVNHRYFDKFYCLCYHSAMKFDRYITAEFLNRVEKGKVSIIYGPRQVGKTTFLNTILPRLKGKIRRVEGDQRTAQEIFSSQRLEILRQGIGDADILVIDEAQRIENIGINLKIIVDQLQIPVI